MMKSYFIFSLPLSQIPFTKASSDLCPDGTADVFIIGAGASGVAAARELIVQDAGLTYAWAEARHEVGGRMRVADEQLCSLTDTNKCWILEDGANWIQGGEGNFLLDLAWEYGLEHWRMDWGSVSFYEINKSNDSFEMIHKNLLPYELFGPAYDCLNEKALSCYENSAGDDTCLLSIRDYMEQYCDWTPDNTQERFVEAYTLDYNEAIDPSDVGMISYPLWLYGYDSQDKDFIVEDERGYKGLLESHMAPIGENDRPTFNTLVTEVNLEGESGDYPVKVTAEHGEEEVSCNVKTVISTLTSGYLINNRELFTPPESGINSILDNLETTFNMSLYYKIFYIFKEPFWDEDTELIFTANNEIETPDKKILHQCFIWVNRSPKSRSRYMARSNILMCTLLTDAVNEITAGSGELDNTQVDNLLDNIRLVYEVELAHGRDYEYHYHPWKTDPLTFGSYETFRSSATRDTFEAATAPLKMNGKDDTLVHWAGNHSCLRYQAWVQGAMAIGQSKARQVINDLCDDCEELDTTSICTEAPTGGFGSRYPTPRGT